MRGGDGCYSEFPDQGHTVRKVRAVGSSDGENRRKSPPRRDRKVKITCTTREETGRRAMACGGVKDNFIIVIFFL